MYVSEIEQRQAAAPRLGDAPPTSAAACDTMRARPLFPRYRLASGWAEVAHEWSVGDLLEAHRICDFMDEQHAAANNQGK